MPKSSLEVLRPAPGAAGVPEPSLAPGDGKRAEPLRARPPALQYVGFRTTAAGREYTLCASGGLEPRMFVVLIPSEAFASHTARFQDGPDLCFRRLRRELTDDPDLLPGAGLVLTTEELLDYVQGSVPKPNPTRRRARPA